MKITFVKLNHHHNNSKNNNNKTLGICRNKPAFCRRRRRSRRGERENLLNSIGLQLSATADNFNQQHVTPAANCSTALMPRRRVSIVCVKERVLRTYIYMNVYIIDYKSFVVETPKNHQPCGYTRRHAIKCIRQNNCELQFFLQ